MLTLIIKAIIVVFTSGTAVIAPMIANQIGLGQHNVNEAKVEEKIEVPEIKVATLEPEENDGVTIPDTELKEEIIKVEDLPKMQTEVKKEETPNTKTSSSKVEVPKFPTMSEVVLEKIEAVKEEIPEVTEQKEEIPQVETPKQEETTKTDTKEPTIEVEVVEDKEEETLPEIKEELKENEVPDVKEPTTETEVKDDKKEELPQVEEETKQDEEVIIPEEKDTPKEPEIEEEKKEELPKIEEETKQDEEVIIPEEKDTPKEPEIEEEKKEELPKIEEETKQDEEVIIPEEKDTPKEPEKEEKKEELPKEEEKIEQTEEVIPENKEQPKETESSVDKVQTVDNSIIQNAARKMLNVNSLSLTRDNSIVGHETLKYNKAQNRRFNTTYVRNLGNVEEYLEGMAGSYGSRAQSYYMNANKTSWGYVRNLTASFGITELPLFYNVDKVELDSKYNDNLHYIVTISASNANRFYNNTYLTNYESNVEYFKGETKFEVTLDGNGYIREIKETDSEKFNLHLVISGINNTEITRPDGVQGYIPPKSN